VASFPSINPIYGTKKTSSPNIRVIRFGDGYEHRVSFGLNQDPKIYDLVFSVSETDSDTIETFLDARAKDAASFTFQPPGESSSFKFVCEKWDKSIPFLNRAIIQATFRQVFEP
tara:strand:+ start:184 stop:525 length:342 start_codon:yes stop_codon:yes gene_type:complete